MSRASPRRAVTNQLETDSKRLRALLFHDVELARFISHKGYGGGPSAVRFEDIVEHQHNRNRLELQPGL